MMFSFYRPAKLLAHTTEIITNEINITLLRAKLAKILVEEFFVTNATLILVSDYASVSPPSLTPPTKEELKNASLAKMLHHVKNILIKNKLTDPLDIQFFTDHSLGAIVPLFVKEEEIGLLYLGQKQSGRNYSSKDISFLNSYAPVVALALKNADNYRKIQEFSHTLEVKIIERTHELEISQAKELKLKDEFVFIASHDLGIPVAAIAGFSALMLKSQDLLPPELRSHLLAIIEASNRLKVLVNDLLQVARSDSGTIKIDLIEVDAGLILTSAVKQAESIAKDKHVTVSLNLADDSTIQADPTKLAEIAENLISNGIKYNKDGGTLAISTIPKAGKLVIEFKDTGLGIDAKEQAKVFTKFFRSEEKVIRERPGTGLGLFVARMLTEKMGGSINFKSVEGEGTTFWLEFSK